MLFILEPLVKEDNLPGMVFVKPLEIAKASQIPRILDINLRAPFYDDAY